VIELNKKDGTGRELGYCLQIVFNCLIQWTDQSKSFRTTMIKEGLIFDNVFMLDKLGSAVGNQVHRYTYTYINTYICIP